MMDVGVRTDERVCLGFEVESELRFETLRTGAGAAGLLRVEEAVDPEGVLATGGVTLGTWPVRLHNPFEARLLADPANASRYAFWTSDVGWYGIDADPRAPAIRVPPAADPLRREVRLWGIPASLCALAAGDLSLHAAAVEIDGHAVLLAGPGFHGKTTLSAAFAAAGHRLLAEDVSRVEPGSRPVLYPGPALVRLRPDMAEAVRLPERRRVVSEERVHVVLGEPARGSGAPIPVALVVFLREVDGAPELLEVPPERAVADLWSLAFRLPTDASRAAVFAALTDLTRAVPILDLRRPRTLAALPGTIDVVSRRALAG